MKIPQIFFPMENLEKKVKQFLKKNYTRHKPYEKLANEKRRKILIYSKECHLMENSQIYVFIRNPKNRGEYWLEIRSTEEFYFPVCNNPLDWGSRMRTEALAYVKSEEGLINYFKLLEEGNDAVLKWEEKYPVLEFKNKFDEAYKKDESA